ncbi:hypothetical protein Hanom_Chr00s001503g01683451 [Helianthus anomalus]
MKMLMMKINDDDDIKMINSGGGTASVTPFSVIGKKNHKQSLRAVARDDSGLFGVHFLVRVSRSGSGSASSSFVLIRVILEINLVIALGKISFSAAFQVNTRVNSGQLSQDGQTWSTVVSQDPVKF